MLFVVAYHFGVFVREECCEGGACIPKHESYLPGNASVPPPIMSVRPFLLFPLYDPQYVDSLLH